MRGFLYFVTLAILNVLTIATPSAPAACPNAAVLQTAEIPVGDGVISYAQFECDPTVAKKRDGIVVVIILPITCILLGIGCPPPPPPHLPPPPQPKSECGASCSISCNNVTAGTLPPIADDCQTIANSIVILQNQTQPMFTVESGHVETLSFGTCNVFFQNLSPETLTYCWSDLGTVATSAGNACFPPNAFSFGEGVCTGYDGLWAAGESHS